MWEEQAFSKPELAKKTASRGRGETGMIAGDMRSPWDADNRKSDEDKMFGVRHDQELLGQILERSSSAPLLPSDFVGGSGYDDEEENVSGPSTSTLNFIL